MIKASFDEAHLFNKAVSKFVNTQRWFMNRQVGAVQKHWPHDP